MILNFNYLLGSERIVDKYTFYFIGESNSGGEGRNADATASELIESESVKILNNLSFEVENLHMDGIASTGKNNLLDHFGLTGDEPWHGWELQLNQRADEFTDPVYLIKCGQGGSITAEWDNGDTYQNKFIQRSDVANSFFSSNSINPLNYVFMSIGINDKIAATNTTTFFNQLVDWVGRIQTQTEAIKIFITTFDDIAGMGSYNTEIINASNAIGNLIRIDTTGATFENPNHWDYDGMKQICNSMLDLI